jgi:hypothetical protein
MYTFRATSVSPAEFVSFWWPQYPEVNDTPYVDNIGKSLTPERVHSLFNWKAGKRFRKRSQSIVKKTYISQLHKINKLPLTTDPSEFLAKYGGAGAIWGIFFLHCWCPAKYPVYDQNVHRAMTYILNEKADHFNKWSHEKKRTSYFERYIPFFKMFQECDSRKADRALFMCGKFLKTTTFPEIVAWRNNS